MRDIVSYHVAQVVASDGNPLASGSPLRQDYLSRFADREGREFLYGFYGRYRQLDSDQILATLAERVRQTTASLAVTFRTLRPEAGIEEVAAFLRGSAVGQRLTDSEIQGLFDAYAIDRFPLNDRGYIAKIHPLELWLAAYLSQAPRSSFAEVVAAGAEARQDRSEEHTSELQSLMRSSSAD